MKSRRVFAILLFIIAVCVISLIPFSNVYSVYKVEGMDTNGNVKTPSATTLAPKQTLPATFPEDIKNSQDLLNAILYVNSQPENKHNDLMYIQKIQSKVATTNSQNAATLMEEMSNPNNLTDRRLFLQYMNWFASHCPLDSSECSGLV